MNLVEMEMRLVQIFPFWRARYIAFENPHLPGRSSRLLPPERYPV